MGSPETEPGRWGDEGPQHRVTLSRGFWLFDTPCTQALWQAVMGTNPSRFKSPDRPVEQVSWDDVQGFLTRINQRVPGLDLALPTEAQWEYACRADTTTAHYSSERAGTHPVAQKRPNGWGLYDMLGNVWEWCRDGQRDYRAEAETDPHGPLQAGAERVVRGGSWLYDARYVRAAFRSRYHPGDRSGTLGFRCARVQVSQAGGAGAEPAAPAAVRQAERRTTAQGPTSGAVLRLDRGAAEDRSVLPRSASFQLCTDREQLTFSRITRPAWAEAIGRDAFGLWAAIAVAVEGAEPVTQRLRWIPPGRFLMGSPETEPEREGDEGPQHPVTLSRGFWLFDTACTQALWRAVMGDHPSRFQSPDRPVEQVSWDDVQGFLTRINQLVPGLALDLPTEAQWEYACRAGTGTPFSFGANITPEQVNYDGKYPYAGGEKGRYREETVPVASLPPNPWGLFEMHGNVWEWCRDGWRDYGTGAETDPHGALQAGAGRVVRGGSWYFSARYLRAAYRRRLHPGYRNDFLGFRCARAHDRKDFRT